MAAKHSALWWLRNLKSRQSTEFDLRIALLLRRRRILSVAGILSLRFPLAQLGLLAGAIVVDAVGVVHAGAHEEVGQDEEQDPCEGAEDGAGDDGAGELVVDGGAAAGKGQPAAGPGGGPGPGGEVEDAVEAQEDEESQAVVEAVEEGLEGEHAAEDEEGEDGLN